MAFGKKPDMSLILGIGKKSPREEAPPPYGGPKSAPTDAPDAMGEGACSITCPKCGESLNLMVQPAPDSGEMEPDAGMPGGDQAVA